LVIDEVKPVLVDTGPIVAFLKAQDNYHAWAKPEWSRLTPPLLTFEVVIAEACFLVRDLYNGLEAVLALIQREII
jgi:predicted nucleic acid-binding protein